jgi:meso-butanediol dehydrogenase/(S,S)-butanediol dehydrogenase/diacetyl reductase
MMRGLAGRAALVTGAASGIGLAIALRLLDEGARVLAVDLSRDGLAALPRRDGLASVHADLTERDAPGDIVAEALRTLGRIDILVNNAGLGNAPSLHETSDGEFDRWTAINLRSVFRLSRDTLPFLIEQRGTILNIASSVALQGYRRGAAYAAAKGGVIALTRNMAAEYGPRGVRVNAVAPGVIETPLTAERLRSNNTFIANVVGTTPLGRAGRSEEIASAVAFLVSDEAKFVTSQVLALDGGQTASVYMGEAIVSAWETHEGN